MLSTKLLRELTTISINYHLSLAALGNNKNSAFARKSRLRELELLSGAYSKKIHEVLRYLIETKNISNEELTDLLTLMIEISDGQ